MDILRFKTWLPTCFLLLASATAATAYQYVSSDVDGDDVAPSAPNRVIHSDEFGRHQTYIDTYQTTNRRQKRTTIAFNRAWKVLLKTTVGFQNIYTELHGIPIKLKAFTKVGSADEALHDFYSLQPTNIEQATHGLVGEVGNKGIQLNTSKPPFLALMDHRDNKISISYFETSAEANNFLRIMKEIFRMQ